MQVRDEQFIVRFGEALQGRDDPREEGSTGQVAETVGGRRREETVLVEAARAVCESIESFTID